MNAFDRVIGYEGLKKELMQVSDGLKNTEVYEKLGVKPPRGLMLYGDPGVGKSLMAFCLIEASGRKAFVCRKDRPDGEFVNHITETFRAAKEAAPSIVFLDDMDKFANNDSNHKDSEEYVTVQSCIDTFRHAEVFVLATANDVEDLPDSLIRPGRFDRVIEVEAPAGKDAVEIVQGAVLALCLFGLAMCAIVGVAVLVRGTLGELAEKFKGRTAQGAAFAVAAVVGRIVFLPTLSTVSTSTPTSRTRDRC